MAVKIRLTRLGAKKAPFYRIVAVDGRKARDGQYLEQIGYYDPTKEPVEIKVDANIANKWLACGAQPTDTVRYLFAKAGVTASKQASAPAVEEGKNIEATAVDLAVKASIKD